MGKKWITEIFPYQRKFCKFLLVMRLLLVLILMTFMQVSASTYSQNTRLNLKLDDATFIELFSSIKQQSEFTFVYNVDDIEKLGRISYEFHESTVEQILDHCLKSTGMTYKVRGKVVILSPQNASKEGSLPVEQPREKTISGSVVDSEGFPLPGVSIIVKGTTIGTITNADGKFSFTVPIDAEALQFSFVGMQSQEIPIKRLTTVSVVMTEKTTSLEEVVAVGYGAQKKQSVVASISQTSGESLRSNVQGSDLVNTLRGQIPGLVTMQNLGIPGGYDEGFGETGHSKILIRGQSTWNEAGPLILVDGVEREMYDINPYEIEKISVLKDASATAVFGVKGANGVILITTLRGKEGKPRLTFDGSVTAKTVSKVPHTLNSYEANLMRNSALINELPISSSAWDNITPQEYLMYYRDHTYPEYFPDVDWLDEMMKTWAFDKNFNVSASGGTSFVKYYSSFSYLREEDILKSGEDFGISNSPHFGYDRFNFRSNLDFDITPTTRFSVNLSGYYAIRQAMHNNDDIWNATRGRPSDLYPIRYSEEDGKWTWANYSGYDRYSNSLVAVIYSDYHKYKKTSISTDFQLSQKLDFITKGLSFKGKLSYDNYSRTDGPRITYSEPVVKWIDHRIVDDIVPGMTAAEIRELESQYTIWEFPEGAAGYDYFPKPDGIDTEDAKNDVYRQLYYEFALDYSRSFGPHSVTGLLLMSRNERAKKSDFTSYREDWVGRVTYNYDSRYLLELNGAYNGSEKFSRDYRFGFFPSVAVGWMLSNEPFFAGATSVVNNLKFRYSDGEVGSDAGIPRWLYSGSWNVTDGGWYFGGENPQESYPITYEGIVPNPDIHWEVARKRNLGVEAGFFDDLLTVTFDYFWEDRSDIFVTASDRIVPAFFGTNPVASNLGEVKVKGWEFQSRISKTIPNGLNLWASLNWSFVVDKVIERGDPELAPDYQKKAGYPIDQPRFLVNQSNGIVNSWNDMYTGVMPESPTLSLPGDFKMIDYNSDGVINSDDKIPYGYPQRPQYTYCPSLGFKYKNLSGNIVFYGIYNLRGEESRRTFFEAYNVVFPENRESWSPEMGVTTNATYEGNRIMTEGSSTGLSGIIYIPRSYLKIQSAELAYNVSPRILEGLGISNLTLRLSGTNLFTWSKAYEDAEVDRTVEGQGTAKVMYPLLKRINFGVSFNF